MSLRELVKSISKREWCVVALASVLAVVLTSVPALYGLALAATRGLEWRGLLHISPGDFALYMSNIGQAKSGHLLFDNLFAVESTVSSLNVFWLSVGWLARLLSLTPLAAFHLVRLLLIPLFAVTVYLAASVFLREPRERYLALALMMFGSGVGLYFAPLFEDNIATSALYQWPIDLWVGESNAFTSMMYSPHFIASWLLIILVATMLLLSFRGGRARYALVAGVAALALFQFHPFHAPTLYVTGFIFLCLMVLARRFRFRDWVNYGLFVIISFWSFAYHVNHFFSDDFARQLLTSNLMLTPSPQYVLFGFGAIAVLAPVGYWFTQKKMATEERFFLAAWIMSSLFLIYAPISFQRRMLQGLEFPLVILAVPAIMILVARLAKIRWVDLLNIRFTLVILFIVVCLPSSFAVMAGSLKAFNDNRPPIFFFATEDRQALDWISANTPTDATFISSMVAGNSIVGWSMRRVYFGHWGNSGDVAIKSAKVRWFFETADSTERVAFMRELGLDYIFFGQTERSMGLITEDEKFERVYGTDEIGIFRLR